MRIFLIVLDSFGIGEAPDAAAFGDEGANTLAAVAAHPAFDCPQMTRLGLFHIDGTGTAPFSMPKGSFARLREVSAGKDTTVGHWEIAGLRSEQPLPTFPNGFPQEFLDEFSRRTGRPAGPGPAAAGGDPGPRRAAGARFRGRVARIASGPG